MPLPCSADVTLRFPLDGYYRPGRYMPVHVKADVAGFPGEGKIFLDSPGAMQTELPLLEGKADAVAPWLPLDARARSPRVKLEAGPRRAEQPGGAALKPLAEGQRLVGYARGDAASAMALVGRLLGQPGAWVAVRLDPSQPLPGAGAAWEALDAVLLDPGVMTLPAGRPHVGPAKLEALAGAGVAVIVHAPDVPAGPSNPASAGPAARPKPPFYPAWPWRRAGDDWVLHYAPAGPPAATHRQDVYAPVAGWNTGWPAPFRRRVVLFGALFAIALLGLALWKPRGVVAWGAGLAAGTVGLLTQWWMVQTPVAGRGGVVIVNDGPWTQVDGWSYHASAGPAATVVRWDDVTRPVFAGAAALDQSGITFRCWAGGEPHEFFLRFAPGARAALLSRRVMPRAALRPAAPGGSSPLGPLVRDLYLAPGDAVIGQIPWTPPVGAPWQQMETWPAVVVEKHTTP